MSTPRFALLAEKIADEARSSDQSSVLANEFASTVPASFEAFCKILHISRKNFAILDLIENPEFTDLDQLDPKLGFSLLARELYHQSNIMVVNQYKDQLNAVKSMADLPTQGCYESLEEVRSFVAEFFQKIGVPIYKIPRSVFHLFCKYRIDASRTENKEEKGFLLDLSKRLSVVSHDVTEEWKIEDVRMIVKGYAAWLLHQTKLGTFPPSMGGLQRYVYKVYGLYLEEKDELGR